MVNVFGMGKYKKYIDDLTAILDASSEIIFLCNNFDITRIQDLFINIIENYNYYEQGKNETSKTELLGDEISGSAEYIKMKEYIDKNFENIKDKCDCFTIKLDGFRRQYLPDNAETEDSDDALIRDNFKSQYKTIRINLEDIERELNKIKKITENDIKDIKDDDIKFNIFPITKSNMMYSSGFYSSFKMIFKNLQIIDSNENEITEEELEEINNDLKKLYINLIKNFNVNTINAQESELKDIIEDLNKEGLSLKDKYDSYIKKGGDVKGEVDEGNGDGEVDGEGRKDGKVKGDREGKGKGEVEGNGENVKNLEEEAERLNIQAEEAKKKADELASKAKLKEGKDDEEQLKDTKDALVAATAAHDAALKAHSAKKAVDKAKLAAAAAAEEDAKKKAEEANKKVEEAKKRAAAAAEEEERKKEEAAEEERKKEEAAKKKKKDEEEAEEAKRKDKEAEDAKKKTEEDPFVLNFEYNNNSCYVNSALQMLIDNDELCVEIVKAANDRNLDEKFNNDALTEDEKRSDEYLLYLLYKIIQYHRIEKHPIGEPKKASYNEYIFPLREYLKQTTKIFNYGYGDAPDLHTHILDILKDKLKINFTYFQTLLNAGDEDTPISLQDFTKTISLSEYDRYSSGTESIDNLYLEIIRKQSRSERDENGNIINLHEKKKETSSTRPITLPTILDIVSSKYKVKGFIHFIEDSHFVYYKFLNNTEGDWVLLDDFDTHTPPTNINDKVSGDPLGNNGKIIKRDVLPNDGSVLIYYKKDDTALNASPIGAIAKKNVPNLQAAQQVGVANATESSFKYSFDKRNPREHTPIYNNSEIPYYLNSTKDKTAKFMASLNAGNNSLEVGLSYINNAFNSVIANIPIGGVSDSNLSSKSARMHMLFNNYLKTKKLYIPDSFYKNENLQINNYFKEMYLYISGETLEDFKYSNDIYPGDVFIDILQDKEWINGGKSNAINNMANKANKAMIYCVGPDGTNHNINNPTNDIIKNKFLQAMLIVGKNIANAINEYNKYKGNENKKIDYVRICLISGNAFLPAQMKIDNEEVKVAEALIKGIHSVNKEKGVKDIVYNFAYADGVFQTAFDKLKNQDTELQSTELIIHN